MEWFYLTWIGTTTPVQSEPESNSNEGVFQDWRYTIRYNFMSYPGC